MSGTVSRRSSDGRQIWNPVSFPPVSVSPCLRIIRVPYYLKSKKSKPMNPSTPNENTRHEQPSVPKTNGVNTLLGDPKKAIIKLSVPIIVSMLTLGIYHLTDSIWVSGLGPDALSAVGCAYSKGSGAQTTAYQEPQKWEYKTLIVRGVTCGPFSQGRCNLMQHGNCIEEDGYSATTEKLGMLGLQNWELVGFAFPAGEVKTVFVFNRPVVE